MLCSWSITVALSTCCETFHYSTYPPPPTCCDRSVALFTRDGPRTRIITLLLAQSFPTTGLFSFYREPRVRSLAWLEAVVLSQKVTWALQGGGVRFYSPCMMWNMSLSRCRQRRIYIVIFPISWRQNMEHDRCSQGFSPMNRLPWTCDCLIIHIYSAELRISQAYILHRDVNPCK